MNENDLAQALNEMAPARNNDALARTVALVRQEMPGVRGRLTLPSGRRLALAMIAVGIAAAIALTPPGRALAERVGELVGIGEPSSVQEANLLDPRLNGEERVGPALVAASGTVPDANGQTFEIVAWAARRSHGIVRSHGIISCLGIVFPDLGSQETGKWCADPPSTDMVSGPVHVFGMSGSDPRFGPTAPYQVVGVTQPDVSRVEVTYVDKSGSRVSAPTALGRLDGDLLEQTGAQVPFGFFAAFIPNDGAPQPKNALTPSPFLQSVEVTAFDSQGQVVGHDDAGAEYGRLLAREHRLNHAPAPGANSHDQLRSNAAQLQSSKLIGSGELPTGDRYQLRGYVGNGNDGGCVVLVWEQSNRSFPNCANVNPGWKEGQVSSPEVGRLPEDESDPGASGTFVTGAAPEQSTEVAIRVPASDGVPASEQPAQLFPISGSISDTSGASAPIPSMKFFVGYLPPGAGNMRSAPPAKAVALNGDEEVSSVDLTWIRFRPAPEALPLIMSCPEGDTTCQNLLSTTKP